MVAPRRRKQAVSTGIGGYVGRRKRQASTYIGLAAMIAAVAKTIAVASGSGAGVAIATIAESLLSSPEVVGLAAAGGTLVHVDA